MRTRTTRLVMLACSLVAASCGGGTTPEPLLATTLVGSYAGEEFIPVNGFATVYQGNAIIVLSDAAVACGTEDNNTPPPGHTTALNLPALAVGSYGNVFVQMYNNVGRFDGAGQNSGSVTISSVTDESIVGEVTFNYTDNEDREFSFTGTFEVAHCAY
ncbi:MAG: hypothetical protein IPL19_16445 [Sandaracinaceae bacterium]|nr:hypothetical protein [Sandaracinaceae bacterium]